MIVEAQIINGFTENGAGGNPAGVVLNADTLSRDERMKIASLIGVSETAFVSSSDIADYKLDFFTPVKQIPHCGHATIATFSYLKQTGGITKQHLTKETIDGTREIVIEGELAFMEQKPPTYLNLETDKNAILKSLGLAEGDLVTDAPVMVVNTGNSYAIIPVVDETVLRKVQPQFDLIREISEKYDLIGYYVFCASPVSERDAETRMFAPAYGIPEEAGTGMAAGPLACYLFDIFQERKETYYISQGKYMQQPSPSLIIVNLSIEHGKINKLMAGGKGVLMQRITIEI